MKIAVIISIIVLLLIGGFVYFSVPLKTNEIIFKRNDSCTSPADFVPETIRIKQPLNQENIENSINIKGYKISEIKEEKHKWRVVLTCEKETDYVCGEEIELFKDSKSFCFNIAV